MLLKNKHLVVLFIFTLVSGLLLARFWPWSRGPAVHAVLMQVDTTKAEALRVLAPGFPAWSLHRNEGGWALLVDNRPFPLAPRQSATLLSAAAQVTSLRVLNTKRLDTLGLGPGQYVAVYWDLPGDTSKRLHIGKETGEGTWVRLPEEQAAFLVSGHLRKSLVVDARRFRSRVIFDWVVGDIDSAEFVRSDTFRIVSRPADADSLRRWLADVAPRGEWAFADYFDETRSAELELARLHMFRKDNRADLFLYRWVPPNLPEDLHAVRRMGAVLPPFVWHCSENPLNYFAMSDTLRAARFLAGPPGEVVIDSTRHENAN